MLIVYTEEREGIMKLTVVEIKLPNFQLEFKQNVKWYMRRFSGFVDINQRLF